MNATATPPVPAGLRTSQGDLIPLRGVKLSGDLVGRTARLRIEQTYAVAGDRPVEAIYTFPVPAEAMVCGFNFSCGDRTLAGEVRERERAYREYVRAVDAGHGAALLERERSNVLSVQVGNLLPGEETKVVVEYLQTVDAADGEWRWAIPTLVAPRYIPGAPMPAGRTGHGMADPTDRVPDADRITPPLAAAVPYALDIDLSIDLGDGIAVESPSHAIDVTPEGGRQRVNFAHPQALDRDLVILARAAGSETPASVVAHRDGRQPGIFALTVMPDLLDRAERRIDIVFVVDTSGSMDGAALSEARAALRLCLRHLRQGDRFDVIEFNTQWRAFAGRLVPYDQQALEAADRWVSQLQATGGTEMLSPLRAAARQAGDGIVVLLTDGEVGNEAEIVRAIASGGKTPRFFTFGIGTNVSDALIRDLARRTGGSAAFIHPGERIDDKVVAQLSRALAPRVEDLRLTFDGFAGEEVFPDPLPALIDGEPWVVLGKFRKAAKGLACLRGRVGDTPFALDVPVDLTRAESRPDIEKRWAAARIAAIEERLGSRGSATELQEITALATKYGLLTRHTAYVAVEVREGARQARQPAETRVVPVNLPAGWAMFGQDHEEYGSWDAPAAASGSAPAVMAFMSPLAPMSPPPPSPRQSPADMGPPDPGFPDDSIDMPPFLRNMIRPSGSPPDRQSRPPAAKAPRPSGPPASPPQLPAKPPESRSARAFRSPPTPPDQPSPPAESLPAPSWEPSLPAPSREPSLPAPPREPSLPAPTLSGVADLLGRQHASGLWGDAAADPALALVETRRALLALLASDVRADHPVYGRQVRKTLLAVLDGIDQATWQARPERDAVLALCILLATGRLRRQATDAASRAGGAGLARAIGDEVALRALAAGAP
ncbi:MAG: VWA domain-containing protein [Candidatus Sericytochromatia bacterium]|nr:VWA domain-containing protein [Candidatus Tanganyikabacteria bacterium]